MLYSFRTSPQIVLLLRNMNWKTVKNKILVFNYYKMSCLLHKCKMANFIYSHCTKSCIKYLDKLILSFADFLFSVSDLSKLSRGYEPFFYALIKRFKTWMFSKIELNNLFGLTFQISKKHNGPLGETHMWPFTQYLVFFFVG